jgi:hypothetical protein
METVCFSETLVSTYKSTQRYNPEEQHLPFMFESKICVNAVQNVLSPFFQTRLSIVYFAIDLINFISYLVIE